MSGIAKALKQVYDETAKEPLPTDFNKLLKEMDNEPRPRKAP